MATVGNRFVDDGRWQHDLAALVRYADAHGTTRPDNDACIPGYAGGPPRKLRHFCANLRAEHYRGRLAPGRQQDVEAAVPGWTWRIRARRRFYGTGLERWRRRTTELASWIADHGRYPSMRAEDQTEATQGSFVADARHAHLRGSMPAEAADQLAAIPGWRWSVYLARPRTWWDRIPDMVSYVTDHGHFPPEKGDPHERNLAHWWRKRHRVDLAGTPPLFPALIRHIVHRIERETAPYAWSKTCQQIAASIVPGQPRSDKAYRWLREQRIAAGAGRLNEAQTRRLAAVVDCGRHQAAWIRRAARIRDDPDDRTNRAWLLLRRRELQKGVLTGWQKQIIEGLDDVPLVLFAEVRARNMLIANSVRKKAANAVTVDLARQALADPHLSAAYRQVLQARADHPDASIAELGHRLGMGKDVYAGKLRRALAGHRARRLHSG